MVFDRNTTIDAVSKLYVHVMASLENNLITFAVFLDFFETFDTIDHNLLLKNLHLMVFAVLPWGGLGII